MKDSIKKFCLRTLLAAMPVILFMAFYALVDPFHVVHPITNGVQEHDSLMVSNNAGFTSVETYLLYNDQYHYDSFILGSSMSQNFKARYWKPYLDSTASILHFDASSETLEGIINKMNFINNHGSTIRNALIIIEVEMLRRQPQEDEMLFIQHPSTSGAKNWFKFHTLHFNAFRDFTQIEHALFPHKYNDEMRQEKKIASIAPDRIAHLNEMFYGEFDSIIAQNPDNYFIPELLATRKYHILPTAISPAINDKVEEQLKQIKLILDRNHTNYTILIPPHNNRPQLQWHDLWVMKSIFGEEKVHNFSSHPELVFNERVYYDNMGHLISAKCKVLLDSAYYEQSHYAIKNPYFKLTTDN